MTVGDLLEHLQQLHPDTLILGWAPVEDESGDMKLADNVLFKLERIQMFDRGNGVIEPIVAKPDPQAKQETVLIVSVE